MKNEKAASASLAPEPELIPREVLFGNPTQTSPQISPDGKKLAYLAPVNNVLNVWVRTIGAGDDAPVTSDTDRGIRHYFWSADARQILYLQDKGGNENWRLYGVDLATAQTRDYTPFDTVQVRIASYDKHYPRRMLIAMNKEDVKYHDIYHLDLDTGALTFVAKNPGNFTDWLIDTRLQVRGAMAARHDGGFDLLIRETAETPWKTLLTWSEEDSATSGPVGFSQDGTRLYLLDSRSADAAQLVSLEIATGKITHIAGQAHYDVNDVIIHPDTYEVQAVSFVKERTEWQVLDKGIEADFKKISRMEKGDFFIQSRTDTDTAWVVGFTKDNGPVPFYLYDRTTGKKEFLFFHKPDLNRYTLAPMEAFQCRASDGLLLHGYITYPPGKKRQNLPMVLNVHGGPWARDSWGYDPEAQWIANRGYVCLQVNYRGSSGYGKAFLNAGNKEWGGRMHQDLIDAVQWAVRKKIADPGRIAIFGGSYGGYAALVGATFTPETFVCAVDIVGPSNLLTFINSIPPYWAAMSDYIRRRVGDPDTEKEFLISRSPLFKVDAIKRPLLIAQGANDPRVNQAESEQIVEALKTKGLEYEYLLFPDEGHGFAKPQNRLKFYGHAERFLAKYLKGRFEQYGSEN